MLFVVVNTLSFENDRNVGDFTEIAFDNYCFPFPLYTNIPEYQQEDGKLGIEKEHIINTEEEYQALLKYRRSWEGDCEDIKSETYRRSCESSKQCTSIDLPAIDFNASTLLGKYKTGSCGAKGFKRLLLVDDSNKTYTYEVQARSGLFPLSCSGPGLRDMNWIVVPKIPENYTVVFKPEIKESTHFKSDGKGGWIELDTYGNVVRKGTGVATSSGPVQFGGFVDCVPQEVYDLMVENGMRTDEENSIQVCEE